eukprot:GFKZ01002196.1.p1 GENE.GFKZ01002196.1~~GFKZ01002196.1.p1  ORF type:complete len:204 (+),score=33.88 GFKZ01002196.1:182-793(+)
MAFVSSFTPRRHTPPARQATHSPTPPPVHTPHAKAPPPSNHPPPPDPPFSPFDGTLPLLPPWRPPSLESDFHYNATRIIHRESQPPSLPLVRVVSPGFGTLFAQLVQRVEGTREGGGVKFWLRPLLLDACEEIGGGFMDLRGGNDVFIDAGEERVQRVAGEMRLRVEVNLAATESDCVGRLGEDADVWAEGTQAVLMRFMKSL